MDDERIVQQLHQINRRMERLTNAMERLVEMVIDEREDRATGQWFPDGYEHGDTDDN